VTSTVFAVSGGDVTVKEVVVGVPVTVPAVDPKSTVSLAAVVENPEPETVTEVPPAVVPDGGDTAVTVGSITSVDAGLDVTEVEPELLQVPLVYD
jgi:hypothetical protein